LRLANGNFTSDRVAEPERALTDFVAIANAGSPMTFHCVPPGSGVRMALDRDEDGVRDRDEIDQGRSPIDRPIPRRPGDPIVPDAGPPPDAPAPDGGVAATGGSGGCCSTSGAESAPGSLLLLAVALLAARRHRRSAAGGRVPPHA
jgi:MYXO-CTERM domain-containing protein